jgi:predicted metalloprotease
MFPNVRRNLPGRAPLEVVDGTNRKDLKIMNNRIPRIAVAAVLAGACLAGVATALPAMPDARPAGQVAALAHHVARLTDQSIATASGTATGGLVEIPSTASCPVQGDLEGRFTGDEMPELLSCIVPTVDGWVDTVYADMPHPVAYEFVPAGVVGATSGGCEYDDTAFQYCLDDQRVYVGEAFVWSLYDEDGDASVAFALAHEVTHHFQSEAGVFDSIVATAQSDELTQLLVETENQADCGGGAFLNYLDRQGLVDQADDVLDIDAVLPRIASAEGAGRDHGTLQERTDSFNLGWMSDADQPLTTCNAFFPDVPLVTAS